MLIICSGPDSFRALARAKELESAFRQKYDQSGASIEHLSAGKDGIDEVVSRAAGASLFSSRRFLRADGIISACPKNKQAALVSALSRDVDSMVVVTVEEERPASSQMKVFEGLPKIVEYNFAVQEGKSFSDWAIGYAKQEGLDDGEKIKKLIDQNEGDAWSYVNEMTKVLAGAELENEKEVEVLSVFDLSDRILQMKPDRFEKILESEFGFSELSVLLQQVKQGLRVRDRDTDGIAPFVVKKLQRMKNENPEQLLSRCLAMLFLQRSGYCVEEESSAMIP